jgi:protein-tyrosine phosphatase
MILFVCTGNTCRSPMAEALMRQRLADRLDCSVDEVEDHGLLIASAGIAAMAGGRSSPGAMDVMRERGLDLSCHESQPLSDRLIKYADIILTMTSGHRNAILAQWPEASGRTMVLCHDQSDVSDPIGGSTELYRRCAEQIESQLEGWLAKIDLGLN